jgi:hypothetical protein
VLGLCVERALRSHTLLVLTLIAPSRGTSPFRILTTPAPDLGHVGPVAAHRVTASFASLASFFLRKCMSVAETVSRLPSTPGKLLPPLRVQ